VLLSPVVDAGNVLPRKGWTLPKTSLVVDDEPSVRNFIIAVLQSDGFQTIEAQNGDQALELIRKLGTGVDLVVSDIRMPLMDGITWRTVCVMSSRPFHSYWFPVTLKSKKRNSRILVLSSCNFPFIRPPF
jgi:DNA-binding NarL/FixJ family response regulator